MGGCYSGLDNFDVDTLQRQSQQSPQPTSQDRIDHSRPQRHRSRSPRHRCRSPRHQSRSPIAHNSTTSHTTPASTPTPTRTATATPNPTPTAAANPTPTATANPTPTAAANRHSQPHPYCCSQPHCYHMYLPPLHLHHCRYNTWTLLCRQPNAYTLHTPTNPSPTGNPNTKLLQPLQVPTTSPTLRCNKLYNPIWQPMAISTPWPTTLPTSHSTATVRQQDNIHFQIDIPSC